MNICFLAYDYPSASGGGGVGNQVRILGRALVRAGHQVTVVDLARPGLPSYQEDEGVRIYRVQPGGLHWYISKLPGMGSLLSQAWRELEYAWAGYGLVRRLHKQTPFDIIEGTETGALGVALGLRDVPLVIRLHGEKYTFYKHTPGHSLTPGLRLSRVLQRMALRRARVLISPSQAHAREIGTELGGKHPPIQVIPNCIDLEQLPPRNGVERDRATVLYVGRLERRKGVLVLLKAAALVVQQVPEAQFLLAGAPHPTIARSEIDALIARHDLHDHVQILGHVPWEELLHLYQRATVCVLPSYYETFGLAALEPMAFGVPVIASRAGALPEVVEDGVTGILVDSSEAQEAELWASSILRVLDAPDWRSRLAQKAYQRLSSQWSASRLLTSNLSVLQQQTLRKGEKVSIVDERRRTDHIFFSPHLDDVVLSCGGRIAGLQSSGDHVRVVTVFAGIPKGEPDSAFVGHLHRKWCLSKHVVEHRRQEDKNALEALGIRNVDHWDFLEAPYRADAFGAPLYASYAELSSAPVPDDRTLGASICDMIRSLVRVSRETTRLYFPLAIGGHVDHRLLYRVGLQMYSLGYQVRFYEEWPYAEKYTVTSDRSHWDAEISDIDVTRKIAAAQQYVSQIHGLGGTPERLAQRITRYAYQVGGGKPRERCWKPNRRDVDTAYSLLSPLSECRPPSTLRDFRRFLQTFTWHDLGEVLPPGSGVCLDVGCGQGRHKDLIETWGYRWYGLDRNSESPSSQILADGQNLPIATGSVNAVVAWQMLKYVLYPERVIAEASRVLKPGGVFCGSVSHLEPVHGHTYYNLSHLALERLLRQHGYVDIVIKSGLSGFALLLWTWFRRWAGDAVARTAIPFTAVWMIPLAGARFVSSWLWETLGQGSGYGMHWVADVAPLEFAGHILFSARKPARSLCTLAT